MTIFLPETDTSEFSLVYNVVSKYFSVMRLVWPPSQLGTVHRSCKIIQSKSFPLIILFESSYKFLDS